MRRGVNNRLPKLARELEKPKPKKTLRSALDTPEPVVWSLLLDEIQATGLDLRPRLPLTLTATSRGLIASRCVPPQFRYRRFSRSSRGTR